jgi:EAL domain-containing protein (putative c-di-GMP-specific phosphodiesterase class I)
METLQRELFEYSEDLIAIVPIFCVIDGCTIETLDSTYYSARVEMINKNIQFYVSEASSEEHLDEGSIRERYHMVNVINYAIANDGVVPYFQGIYDNKRMRIHHYEALMRLKDENGKIYYPNSFLSIARTFGLLYDEISKIMIRKVFDRFRDEAELSVSINLGIRDIKNKEITDLIYDELSKVSHPGNYIFEILENEDIADYNELIAFVDRVHELGGLISIDDFGSGFSNLKHLMSIRSDFLKIDGSIVVNCCNSKQSENIIALIMSWKKLSSNNIRVVAEFVENDEIQKKLIMYDVDYSQGYLFSRPSPDLMESEEKKDESQ